MTKRILLVEDTKAIRDIVARLLRSRGYEVVESADGEDAWEKATSMAPDCIVLDMMLPLKNGFEVAADLKHDDRWSQIPILILSAVATSGEAEEHSREKIVADAFLSKPFKAAELISKVTQLLGENVGSP